MPRRRATSERKMTAAKTRAEMATRCRPSSSLLSAWGSKRAAAMVAKGVVSYEVLKRGVGMVLTGSKREHVGKRPGRVEDDMELSRHEEDPPAGDDITQTFAEPRGEEGEA